MKTSVEVRIKMEGQKEVVLDQKEAEELYQQLKALFDKPAPTIIPYPYPVNPYPWRWNEPYWTWTSSGGSITMSCSNQ